MISKLTANGYRKFDYLELNNLNRINIFVGDNNVGKTTVLESVYGWASGQNLSPFFSVGIQRNQWFSNMTAYHIADNIVSAVHNTEELPLSFKFSAVDDDNEINFEHKIIVGDIFKDFLKNIAMSSSFSYVDKTIIQNLVQNSPQIFIQPNNTVPLAQWEIIENDTNKCVHNLIWPNMFINNMPPQKTASFQEIDAYKNIDENINLYSYLKRRNLMESFTNEMKKIFPDIIGFDILQYRGSIPTPVSVKLKTDEYLPLHTFGEGFRRLYQIIGSLIFYQDNILCIDEIDATIHPNAQKDFCKYLIFYSRKYNVQLFLTTHNLEFIDNMLEIWKEMDNSDDIRIITMKNINNKLKTRTMTSKEALSARENFRMELR